MTVGEMLTRLYQRLNYAASPDSAVTARLTDFLNEGLEQIYSRPGLASMLSKHQPALTFASVANQATYAIPGVPRIDAVREATNDRRLEMRSHDWYRSQEPDPTANTGTPSVWVPMGFSAVAVQPADASEIFIDSTSASDTNTVYIEAIRTGGYPVTLSTSMTGVTAKTLGAAYTDIIQITKFYISAAAVGTVTLHEDASGGTELARIPIGETFARYFQLALWPTPASAITYTADSGRDLPEMTNTLDEPPFPRRFHRALLHYALWQEWDKKDDTRAEIERAKYDAIVRDLVYHVTCPPDDIPSRLNQGVGRSRLGGAYPATDW